MTPEEFARDSWQHDGAAALPPITELRARADKFRRTIVRRNWTEYAAGAFVLVAFGAMALFGPLLAMRIGAALVVGGTVVVLWQLHKRGSPLTPAMHGGALSVLDYQRCELVRQRDALDSVFTWYLLPLIPGMIVLMAAPQLSTPMAEWEMPSSDMALPLLAPIVVFASVWVLNKFGARQLQRKIQEIDALRG